MGFLDLFRTRKLSSVLNQTFDIKAQGVKFTVRKLNPMDFMAGYKTLVHSFDTYKTATETQAIDQMVNQSGKMKEHFTDVFLAAVIEPKLVRKQADSDKGIWVENLYSDWDLVNELYSKIMEVTYGKKKLKLPTSPKTDS